MNKIKSQFKAFWAYFRLTRYGAAREAGARPFLFCLICAVVTMLAGMFQMGIGDGVASFDITIAFFVGAAIGMGVVTAAKPSLMSVAPFSPKQRVIFSYLSAVLNAFLLFVFYMVCVIIFMLIIAFFAFITTGINIFVITDEEITPTASGWCNAFMTLYFFYMFFASYTVFHIDRKKYRNAAAAVWFVVTEALILVLINCCADAYCKLNGYERYGVQMFSLLSVEYDYLAHPWVPVLVLGILTAAVAGLSVWLSIRRHRSGKV